MKGMNPYNAHESETVATAEKFILHQVKRTPATPVELVRAMREERHGIQEAEVREAMWRLVSKGAIEFSKDWRLTLAQ